MLLVKFKSMISNIFTILYWYLEGLYGLFVSPPMNSIDREVILVTGANKGIGREMCRYIVNCGKDIKLIMWDLEINELNTFAEELKFIAKKSNNQVFCYEIDISTKENIENGCNLVREQCGPVTIIFNNAAVAPPGNFLQITDNQINQIFQVNLMSHFWTIRNFLPSMVANNHGRIVNICSVGGVWAGPYNFPYFSSKFGGHGYMEALKIELDLFECDGIHCTTVYPNFVKTPLIGSLALNEKNSLLPQTMKTFLEADQVAIKIVDGVRRGYEFIYLPWIIPYLKFLEYFVPKKLSKSLFLSHTKSFYYKDKEEQKIMEAPFVSNNGLQNGLNHKRG